MKIRKLLAGAFAATIAVAVSVSSPGVAPEMVRDVQLFLAALDSELRSTAEFSLDDEERLNWHFIPRKRAGVSLKALDPAQRSLAQSLLSTGLSREGLRKALQIIYLEEVLHQRENQNPTRDPDQYFLSVFGTPSANDFWGWRFEGHHLSLNFTLKGNDVVANSPSFFGANPAVVQSGPMKGLQVLKDEEELGRRLLRSLGAQLGSKAVISQTAPADIITGARRVAQLESVEGLVASRMPKPSSDLLRRLLKVYAERNKSGAGNRNLGDLSADELSQITFAWAGGLEPGEPHYYRIKGPDFLIEYDNTQDGANHVHTVFRDLKNDFGRDVLKEHYQHFH
jgi:hypothetical protein